MSARTARWALPAALLLYVVAVGGWLAWRELGPFLLRWNLDLHVYYAAGHWLAAGHHTLYGKHFTEARLDFTYTPFAALAFAVLALAPVWVVKYVLVLGGGVVALTASTWLVARRLGHRGTALTAIAFGVAALAMWTEPVQQTLYYGQINLTLLLIVLADVLWFDRHPRVRPFNGVGVGLAAGIKLVPAIFVLYLLVTGRIRAAIMAGTTFLATVAAGWLVLPGPSETFWTGVFVNTKRVGKVGYVGNQSLLGMAFRGINDKQHAHVAWLVAALVVAAVGLWLARLHYRAGREVVAVLIAGTVGLLCSPISWSHHWVWVAVALVLGVHLLVTTRRLRWAVALAATAAVFCCLPLALHGYPRLPLGLIWLAPFNPHEHVPHLAEYHWTLAQSVLGNAYSEVGLLFLAVLAVGAIRQRRRSRSELVLGTQDRDPQGESVGAVRRPGHLDGDLATEGPA